MWSDIELNINDTKSGAGSGAGTGNHCKIGVSSVESSDPIVIRGSMDTTRIRELLGKSPLADACIDSVEHGASLIYCMPVAAGTQGTFGSVTKEGTGAGTITPSGNPTNSFDVIIRIEKTGAVNEATCVISEDGGFTYGDEMTIPLAGTYVLPNTGITLTFASEGSAKFVAGDVYSFKATAPSASNEAIIAAAGKLRDFKGAYEFIHIAGPTTPALWASLEAMGKTWEKDNGRPMIFLCEQRMPAADETAAAYSAAIASQAAGINGRHVAVSTTWMRYTALDGRQRSTNFAGILCGWLARSKESTSAAFLPEFSLPEDKVAGFLPADILDYAEVLETARYIVLRTYNGKEGYYAASANMTISAASDFCDIEICRVMYRIAREVYQRSLDHLNEDFDQSNLDVEMKQVQEDLNVPVDQALAEKIISGGQVTLLLDQMSGNKDKTLPVRIEILPRGYIRKIILDMYCVNALAQ